MTQATTTSVQCPACQTKGRIVKPLTVRALLREELADQVADGEYRYCDSKDCDVVYFGDDRTFTKPDLKVPVGVKEMTGERPLCYCFGHSIASIKQELQAKGRTDALADIRRQMKQPGCRCETENPSGSCCLGTVASGVETAKTELGLRTTVEAKAETITKVGTLVSAIVASACCWLPLLLLAVGVSGVGIASMLESYRPAFIVLTFGFLAAAFYFTYRPRKAVSSSEACCDTGSVCCPPSNTAKLRWFSMMALNKVMLWVVTILAVAFLLFPSYVGLLTGRTAGNAVTDSDPLVRQTIIAIEGMHCEGCAGLVEKAIEDAPGVLDAKVEYEKKQAIVSTEACCPFPKDDVLNALEQAGYTARLVETK